MSCRILLLGFVTYDFPDSDRVLYYVRLWILIEIELIPRLSGLLRAERRWIICCRKISGIPQEDFLVMTDRAHTSETGYGKLYSS